MKTRPWTSHRNRVDAAGTELPPGRGWQGDAPGNVVTIKSRSEFGSDVVVEMRLVREGPAEQVLENATVVQLAPKSATLKANDKLVAVSFDNAIRLLGADGQKFRACSRTSSWAACPRTFKVTLKFAESSGVPVVTEAREVVGGPGVGTNPPADTVTIKSAVVKRINIERGAAGLALVEAGKPRCGSPPANRPRRSTWTARPSHGERCSRKAHRFPRSASSAAGRTW